MKEMKKYVCPRCDYPLVPVLAVDEGRRRVIALTCPEPYCGHTQLVPRDLAEELERAFRHRPEEEQAEQEEKQRVM
ncbi:MAG: hypothetical protein AB1726_00090 [Planctomycetota bacterium]